MKDDYNLKEDSEFNQKIEIFKKINSKIKILQLIIFIILAILLIIIISKFVILNKIEYMSENTDYTNYYQKIVETTDKLNSKIEYYQNGDNFFMIHTKISDTNEILQSIEYKYNGTEYRYSEINGKELLNEGSKEVKPLIQYKFLNRSFLGNIGLSLIPNSLQQISLYKQDCYLLKVDNYLNFIDKETDLTVKEINISNNSVIDYIYSFDTVTDEFILELINCYKNRRYLHL